MPLILEGIVTTLNADQSANISPMGPSVDRQLTHLTLRPFPTSTTFANLKRTRMGVFHVVDDVKLIAEAAVGLPISSTATVAATTVEGNVLVDACQSIEFRVVDIDESLQRMMIQCEVTHRESRRDFFGFNRAKHAVIEAAILATRLHLVSRAEIEKQWRHLQTIVDKTCGDQEHRAFQLLTDYVDRWWSDHPASALKS